MNENMIRILYGIVIFEAGIAFWTESYIMLGVLLGFGLLAMSTRLSLPLKNQRVESWQIIRVILQKILVNNKILPVSNEELNQHPQRKM